MSTPFELTFDFELLACDSSNYASSYAHVLDIFRTIGPQIKQIVVVSISPLSVDRSKLTQEEEKCLQLNAQASYILIHALSEDVFDAIMDEDDDYDTNHDAHRIWTTLKKMYGACEDLGQDHKASSSGSGSEVANNCSSSEDHMCHRPHEESTAPKNSSSQQYTHKCFMDKHEKEREVEDEEFKFEFDKTTKRDKKEMVRLMKKVDKQGGELERQEDYLIERIKELESLNEEMRKLNETNVSLLDKFSWYDQVLVESCDDLIAQENNDLKQEVEKIKMDLSRLKGKGFAQPSQDNRDAMVKNIEEGSTLQSSCNNYIKPITRCFNYHEKGHKIASCTRKKSHSGKTKGFLKAQEKYMGGMAVRSKVKKATSNIKRKVCYACRQKGDLGKDCPNGSTPKLFIHSDSEKLGKNLNDSCATK
uniref:CCHC-type domain-containing protein n=1 Tax=Setaria italica TaxID=4555 RepID=K3Y2J5_SETIT